jgi:hypothetical protein
MWLVLLLGLMQKLCMTMRAKLSKRVVRCFVSLVSSFWRARVWQTQMVAHVEHLYRFRPQHTMHG